MKLAWQVKEALQVKFNKDQEARKNGEKPDPSNGPDPELNAQVLSWMFTEEAKEGWILEGYPRTQAEADALKKQGLKHSEAQYVVRVSFFLLKLATSGILVDKLVVVNISDSELIDIATGRRMDLTTNTMYHIHGLGGWNKPPEDEQVGPNMYHPAARSWRVTPPSLSGAIEVGAKKGRFEREGSRTIVRLQRY
eukprot:2465481-Rhodomonas_salina.1